MTYPCDDELRNQLRRNLSAFQVRQQSSQNLKAAAVAVTVVQQDSVASIVVTRRSSRLRAHRGQWAMPGGRLDEGENAVHAAIRELREEVNLHVEQTQVLGVLDDYVTRSGYRITPVVIWSGLDLEGLEANPDEVESIHGFSFTELSRDDSPNLQTIADSDRPVLSMNYLDDVIFAPTAAMLYQFREVGIHGRDTRVLHYDQPVFAWR